MAPLKHVALTDHKTVEKMFLEDSFDRYSSKQAAKQHEQFEKLFDAKLEVATDSNVQASIAGFSEKFNKTAAVATNQAAVPVMNATTGIRHASLLEQVALRLRTEAKKATMFDPWLMVMVFIVMPCCCCACYVQFCMGGLLSFLRGFLDTGYRMHDQDVENKGRQKCRSGGNAESKDTPRLKLTNGDDKGMCWWSKLMASRWAVMSSMAVSFCTFDPLKGLRSGEVVANDRERDPALIDPDDFTQEERDFFRKREQREGKHELHLSTGFASVLLIVVTIISLSLANSVVSEGYIGFWEQFVGFGEPYEHLKMSVRKWINGAMMAFFFFGCGLEIKNEVLFGSLRTLQQAALPCFAALGGMLVPIFLFITVQVIYDDALDGWAAPMATDIAFAMGVYNLFRNKMPAGAAAFLLAFATVDDLGAMAVIAVAFSSNIYWKWLVCATVACALFEIMRRNRVRNSYAWLGLGVVLWYCLLRGGINPDIAGVLTAFFIPTVSAPLWTKAPGALPNLIDHYIYYWAGLANFLIMPIFATANTAIYIKGSLDETLASPVAQGILIGLLVGKPLGIAGFSWLALKAGLCKLPTGMSCIHLVICGFLGGIAFTMSLFVIEESLFNLSVALAKLAVICASTIAAILGMLLMYIMSEPVVEEDPQ